MKCLKLSEVDLSCTWSWLLCDEGGSRLGGVSIFTKHQPYPKRLFRNFIFND